MRIAGIAVLLVATVAHADRLVIDFGADPKPWWNQIAGPEETELVKRFPDPHAGGKSCDPNRPGTPPDQRAGGILLPYITSAHAAITRPGADQIAYVIDYCPTGAGVPRTRRLVVLDGKTVVIDRELPPEIAADAIIAAADVDGDGRAELVLTDTIRRARPTLMLRVVRATAKGVDLLGSWTGIDQCEASEFPDETVHRLTTSSVAGKLAFHDAATTRHCYYPPAPPPHR